MSERNDAKAIDNARKLANLGKAHIDMFDATVKADGYTDTGEAWELLEELRIILDQIANQY